jgi:hypothetical protein
MSDKTEPSELLLNPGFDSQVWIDPGKEYEITVSVEPPPATVVHWLRLSTKNGEVVLRYKPEPMPADPLAFTRELLKTLEQCRPSPTVRWMPEEG